MANHPNRATPPTMHFQSYRSLANELRHLAEIIELNSTRKTPQEKRSLTQAINNAHRVSQSAYRRHNGYGEN